MRYILYKKKYINGKKRRLYKKEGSNKLYLKHKGRMLNVVKYKKYIKKKRKSKKKQGGGIISFKNFVPNMKKQGFTSRVKSIRNDVKRKIENKIEKRNLERINFEHNIKMKQRKRDLNECAKFNSEKTKTKRRNKHPYFGSFVGMRNPKL
jgi:hypothetical protein